MTLVLDASVAVKLAVQESGREDIVSPLAVRDDPIVVPDLLFVEVVNALWRKCVAGEVVTADLRFAGAARRGGYSGQLIVLGEAG